MKLRTMFLVLLTTATLICSLGGGLAGLRKVQASSQDNETKARVIKEIKGAELTRYANTGKSHDNMENFCYGWMVHARDKTERSMFTQIVDDCIVFQAEQDEFLPGGYLFMTEEIPGMICKFNDLEPEQKLKIAYVINIDPISKNYTDRLLNFELDGIGRQTIAIESGNTDTEDAWGDQSDTLIPQELLGKDIRITFNIPIQANQDGAIDINLINYSAAYYPLFVGEKVNINIDGNNAPFKMVIKAVQFIAYDGKEADNQEYNGSQEDNKNKGEIEVIEEGFAPLNIGEAERQEFTSNLERSSNEKIYTDAVSTDTADIWDSILIIGGIAALIGGLGIVYFIRLKRNQDGKSSSDNKGNGNQDGKYGRHKHYGVSKGGKHK